MSLKLVGEIFIDMDKKLQQTYLAPTMQVFEVAQEGHEHI